MPTPIKLTALASDFEAGRIASWHKAIGDRVEKGDALFDVESDKAVVAVEAECFGVLGAIRVPGGSPDVPVNTILGYLLHDGETEADIPQDDLVLLQITTAGPAGRIFASPLARRIAAQRGVDLSAINGRGPNGRILKADVEADDGEAAIQSAVETRASLRERAGPADVPHTTIRRVIAERLTAAKRDVPHFYLTLDCELDALLRIRRQLNEHFEKTDIKISINDCVVKAAALALVAVPAANASWSDDVIHRHGTVDISVAVATERGLMTPIVRNADIKPLTDISQEMKMLAARAIAGKLEPNEFRGGGFSISNLGMYGIKHFSAIINPPQACILAVGAAEKRPVVRDERLEIGTVMTCTLSVDHRSVDGAMAAELLGEFKKFIERPALLLLPHRQRQRAR